MITAEPTINGGGSGKPLESTQTTWAGRAHPQSSFSETMSAHENRVARSSPEIDPTGFYGRIRELYSGTVLKTQLGQLKKQGSYDAFKLKWHPAYDVRRLSGGRTRQDGIPPSLFWESDVGKWIEAVCYFLHAGDTTCPHKAEFESAVQELVDMIETAQMDDGYVGIYFQVVDPKGRFKHFRDMHEMYNAGHLLEAALAHHQYTGSRQFLDVMIKNVACLSRVVGPGPDQLHAYPGHPEIELALLRLHSRTGDEKHLNFAKYLLSERGRKRIEFGNETFFEHEARQRDDLLVPHTIDSIHDLSYHQAHLPLHDQNDILGHSVRAFYLLTACADLGGEFGEDAKRLYLDTVQHKMYATGGLGTWPRIEGFHPARYHLPQSTGEGGCYAETCASIALMMTCERLLSHKLDGDVRDTLELALLNNALGGGSLDGHQFSYANKHATWGDETAIRNDWFEVCCCPPNLSRTLGILGGYTWSATIDTSVKVISVSVYLFTGAKRTLQLPAGQTATISLDTQMPWRGHSEIKVKAPDGWSWKVAVPKPEYATSYKLSGAELHHVSSGYGFVHVSASSNFTVDFDMPAQLIASHPLTGAETLVVRRGPIVYTAESFDNAELDKKYPHFEGLGIRSDTTFRQIDKEIAGVPVVMLETESAGAHVSAAREEKRLYRPVRAGEAQWTDLKKPLVFVPWFARANRGGAGHVRTAFRRVD